MCASILNIRVSMHPKQGYGSSWVANISNRSCHWVWFQGGRFSEECQGDDLNSDCLIAGGAANDSNVGGTEPPCSFGNIWSPWSGAEWRPGEAEVLCGGSSKWQRLYLMWMMSELQWKLWEDQQQQVWWWWWRRWRWWWWRWWWWWWFWSYSLVDKLHRSQVCRRLIQMCM